MDKLEILEDTAALKQQVENFLRSSNPSAAKAPCTQLCKSDASNPQAWFLMSTIHTGLGEHADAETCCREVIRLAPGVPDAHVLLGDCLSTQKNFQAACASFDTATALAPENVDIYRRLAVAASRASSPELARKALNKIQDIVPGDIAAMLELAQLERNESRLSAAIQVYESVLLLDPNNRTAHEKKGYIHLLQEDSEAALESYTNLARLKPGDVSTWLLTARIAASQGSLNAAADVCRQALSSNPEHIALLCEMGKILTEQGRKAEALEYFQAALKHDPDNNEIHYLSACVDKEGLSLDRQQKFVADLFDAYAENFDTHLQNRLGYQIPEVIYKAAKKHLPADATALKMLDLGCGTGLCGQYFQSVAIITGVDLSPKMIAAARKTGFYDKLIIGDILELLQQSLQWDLVVAADVYIYVGDMEPSFKLCSQSLSENGLFIISTESLQGEGYSLRTSGRYGHSPKYIEMLCSKYRFSIVEIVETTIRKEGAQRIPGHVHILKKA